MTESNTPPENQKKKSAFSRFFSRKKSPKTPEGNEADVIEASSINDTSKDAEISTPKDIQNTPVINNTTDLKNDVKTNEGTVPISNTEPETSATQSVNTDSITDNQDLNQKESQETEANEVKPQPKVTLSQEVGLDKAPEEPTLQSSTAIQSVEDNSTIETAEKSATVEDGLNKSRTSFFKKISNVFKGSFNLDDDLFDELEELLITSDIGVDVSLNLVEKLRNRVKTDKIQDADGVIVGLRKEISSMLSQSEQDWQFAQKPYVILMVGVNGAGKTTTTAKIAKQFQDQGKSVMLAAADTFRAAAVEQLQEWGKRLDIPVIAQAHGADAAAVAHDALTSAIARDVDVLMIDTAGRLHTQSDLMEQLQKVNRVLAKIDPSTPHEVMQVLDSSTGQNALNQLDHFQKAVGVSSICLSKLDGSAKGGIAISLSEKYKLPIRFIGVGEGFDDIKRFSATQFADALIPDLEKQ